MRISPITYSLWVLFLGVAAATARGSGALVPVARPVSGAASMEVVQDLRGGGFLSGRHPFGYRLTPLGERFLSSEGARECDLGRFLASLKSTLKVGRKTKAAVKNEWLEVLRYAKTAEATRIYRTLEDLLKLCLDAGFLD